MGFTYNSEGFIRVKNTSYKIVGTLCNGCDYCEVLIKRRNTFEQEIYMCDILRAYVDPYLVKNLCNKRFQRPEEYM